MRVVNVVEPDETAAASEHPHGLSDRDFDALFTKDKPVIFAFHGYPWLIHRLTYRRTNHKNIHVRGYKEEGTTTTPFDMVVMNDLDRFHLVEDVIDRLPQLGSRAAYFKQAIHEKLIEHKEYIDKYGDDMPAISGWKWGTKEPAEDARHVHRRGQCVASIWPCAQSCQAQKNHCAAIEPLWRRDGDLRRCWEELPAGRRGRQARRQFQLYLRATALGASICCYSIGWTTAKRSRVVSDSIPPRIGRTTTGTCLCRGCSRDRSTATGSTDRSAPERGLRFDPAKVLLDPYGRGVVVPKNYDREAAKRPGITRRRP